MNNYKTVTIKQQETKKVNKITFQYPLEEKYIVTLRIQLKVHAIADQTLASSDDMN